MEVSPHQHLVMDCYFLLLLRLSNEEVHFNSQFINESMCGKIGSILNGLYFGI